MNRKNLLTIVLMGIAISCYSNQPIELTELKIELTKDVFKELKIIAND